MSSLLLTIALLTFTPNAEAASSEVRVSLFSLFKPQVIDVHLARGAAAVLDTGRLGGGRELAPDDRARVMLAGESLTVTLLDSFGRVRHSVASKQARIIPQGQAAFDLVLPGKMRRHVRGEVTVRPREARPRGWLQVTLATDVESVVTRVVAAEMYGRREAEALKALSVVARTFMLSHAGRHREEGFDFCDTTHCQLYRGEADLNSGLDAPAVARAVAETAGEVLTSGGQTIEAYFTAVCGGLSATPESVWGGAAATGYTYRRVQCPWCKESPYMRWERRAGAPEVLDALSAAEGVRLSQSAEILVEEDGPGGPVRRVIIRDKGRRLAMSAEEFRRAIGLRIGWNRVLSPTFRVERRGRQFIFRGRGFGSQVGMCLAGAGAQAAAGRGYRDILEFYYPQSEIGPGRSAR